jgi:hypothetical protein
MIARLRAIPSSQWRYELLLIAVLCMEASLAAGWFLLLNPLLAPHGAGAAFAGALGLMTLAYVTTRLLSASTWTLKVQRGLLLGLLLLIILGVLALHVYAGRPWISAFFYDLGRILSLPRGGPLALVALLVCWQRGMSLAYRDTSLWSVGLSFRLGVLSAALVGFLWPAGSERWLPLIVLFFFASLMAVALARVDELASREPGADQPFNLTWGSIVAGAATLAVGLGLLIAQAYSPAGLGRLLTWLWPGLQALGRILERVLEWVMLGLLPFLEWLFAALAKLLQRLGVNMGNAPLPTEPATTPTPMFEGVEPAAGFPWMEILRWSAIIGLILVALVVLALSLRRMRQRRRPDAADVQRAGLPAGQWADDLLDGLRAGAERLADALGILGRFGVNRRLYAAISIRFIYANVTRLAAQRGRPRPPATTPYEYLPTLREAFADVDAALARITEAYVGVHYGEAPATLAELREIRQCWERVRAAEEAAQAAE